MASYKATVERDGKWWLVTMDGVGVTQARSLRYVDTMAREVIMLMVDDDDAHIDYDRDLEAPRRSGWRSAP